VTLDEFQFHLFNVSEGTELKSLDDVQVAEVVVSRQKEILHAFS
jgi:hypothetical protein